MMSTKIISVVVVEDHAMLREELAHFLCLSGFEVQSANCGLGLQDVLASRVAPPDIVVLDVNLPGEDGLTLAQRLRTVYPDMGLVILTGRKSPIDKVSGYESGADIYLTKPVSGEELVAVLNSLVRRMHRTVGEAWQLDAQQATITSPLGKRSLLSPNECTVLARLAHASDEVVEAAELLSLLGDDSALLDKGYLEVLLSRLRKKLVDLAPGGGDARLIRAVRNRGYQLLIRVEIR